METDKEQIKKHAESVIYLYVLLNLCTYVLYAEGLLQMQLILHYDMMYREVKYSNLGLEDIDRKMLMGINVTPIIGLLYTPVLIR